MINFLVRHNLAYYSVHCCLLSERLEEWHLHSLNKLQFGDPQSESSSSVQLPVGLFTAFQI